MLPKDAYNPEETFGSAIKRARIEKGLSLRETARRVGISHAYLSQLENGRTSNPSLTIVFKLAEELDVSFAYLMYLSGVPIGEFKVTIPEEMLPALQLSNINYIENNESLSSFEEFKKAQIQKGIALDTPEDLEESKKIYDQLLKVIEIENDLRSMALLSLKINDYDNDYKEFHYEIDDTYKHTFKFEVPAYKTDKIGGTEFTNYIPPEKALESFFDVENLLNLNPELLNFRGRKITNDERDRIIKSIESILLLK